LAVDLTVEIAGVKFKNPIWVASSELAGSLDNTFRAITSGAGGVILKSIADNPRYNDPRITRWRVLDENYRWCRGKVPRNFTMYSRGGPAQHPDVFLRDIEQKKKWARENNVVLIGSIAESNTQAWVRAAELIAAQDIPMIELNFGSPHAEVSEKTTGMELGQDINKIKEITSAVARAVPLPLIVKLTQQVVDMVETAGAAREAGAVGVTVSNRHSGFLVDVDTGKPYLSGPAGVGGPWVKPLTMGWVYKIYSRLQMPVTASGGASDWKDAAGFLLAGATAVQYCSSVIVKGYQTINRAVAGLEGYLDQKGYSSVVEMVGSAARAAIPYKEILDLPRERAVATEPELCHDCGICLERCLFGAISQQDKGVSISDQRCVGCGLCVAVCPSPGALELVPR